MGETSSVWIIIPDLEGKQRTFAASKQNKEMILVTTSNCENWFGWFPDPVLTQCACISFPCFLVIFLLPQAGESQGRFPKTEVAMRRLKTAQDKRTVKRHTIEISFGHIASSRHAEYDWANYNNSLTWNKAMLGWFLLLTMIPVRSPWGRYNFPREYDWLLGYCTSKAFSAIWWRRCSSPFPPHPPRRCWSIRPAPAAATCHGPHDLDPNGPVELRIS